MKPGAHTIDSDQAKRQQREREMCDQVLRYAEHFTEPDKLLLEQVYRFGLSACDIARLSKQSPRTVRRRVKRLTDRLRDPLFRFVVKRGDLIPKQARTVSKYVVLEGRSMRDAARLTRKTLHEVRRDMLAIQTLFRVH